MQDASKIKFVELDKDGSGFLVADELVGVAGMWLLVSLLYL